MHFRYFGLLTVEQRTAHARLTRICFNDYEREIAIVAIRRSPESKEEEIIGIGRLMKVHGVNAAEFAIVVSDECQGQGLGTRLLSLLVEIGRKEGLERIFGHILPENYGYAASFEEPRLHGQLRQVRRSYESGDQLVKMRELRSRSQDLRRAAVRSADGDSSEESR